MATVNGHNEAYTMPFEGVKHSHTLMAFPSILSADSESDLIALQKEVTTIANAISRFEPVHLMARPDQVEAAKSLSGPNVHVKPATADQLWIRDSGPVYVQNKRDHSLTAVSFNFNYWGKKLPETGDEGLAKQIAQQAKQPVITSSLVLEGGGIEHDGEGTFMGAESCILNQNRNPGASKEEVEAELTRVLGVTSFIWIPGIEDFDITDYHIDAIARFIEPGVVLLSRPAPGASADAHRGYKETRAILERSKDAKGRSLTIHECEEPDVNALGPPDSHNECVASYANYLLVNGAVMLAKFDQESQDQAALDLFKKLFPQREVVQVPLNMLPRTGGGIHCGTQQVPAV